MTSKERILRTFEHKETDRVPICDTPWGGTVRLWEKQGMPVGTDWREFFDIDKIEQLHVDTSPRYEVRVLEETDDYVISTTEWGVTLKSFKTQDSTPEFLDFKVNDSEKWLDAKARMVMSDDRINWDYLKQNYDRWQKEGSWTQAVFWFGFDVAHSWMVGTETMLIAMLTEPEWAIDVFSHYLDMSIAGFQKVLDAGYHFDSIFWPDDMGYKNTQFFSIDVYRSMLKPLQKRAADWAHERGIKVHLHSCGQITPFVPELVEIGIDCLNPLEVKAGMNPVQLKSEFGDKLAFHGGFNALSYENLDVAYAELDTLIPIMMQGGGYIFSSDHSIPSSVSLDTFRKITDHVKKIGKF